MDPLGSSSDHFEWIAAHLFHRGNQGALEILQESPWMIHSGRTEENTTTVLGGGVFIMHENLGILFSLLGEGCLKDAEIYFKVYDPWTYSVLKRHFTMQDFPNVLYVPVTNGYLQTLKCKGVELNVGCAGLQAKTPYECLHSLKRDEEKRAKRKADPSSADDSYLTDAQFERVSKWIANWRLQEDVPPNSPSELQHAEDRIEDSYGKPWFYEILNVRPGTWATTSILSTPNIAACIGGIVGCINCWSFWTSGGNILLCYPPCSTLPGATCGAMFGRMVGAYYNSRSVICTELYQQGFIDLESYVADEIFGGGLIEKRTLIGYHLVAAPIVRAMKQSQIFTGFISLVAQPWIQQMKYATGFQSTPSVVGTWMMNIGIPLCNFLGVFGNSE